MKKTAMIVSTQPALLHLLSATLAGYCPDLEVIVASDGSKAVEMAQSAKPDLVILDVMLPGSDGTQVSSMLRRESVTGHTRVVALTASLGKNAWPKIKQVEADAYLIMPFSPTELLRTMDQLMAPTWGPIS